MVPNTGIDDIYLPGIAPSTGCLLSSYYGKVFYLNVLVVPLLCLNVAFFVLSAWNLVYGVWANRGKHRIARGHHQTRSVGRLPALIKQYLRSICETASVSWQEFGPTFGLAGRGYFLALSHASSR